MMPIKAFNLLIQESYDVKRVYTSYRGKHHDLTGGILSKQDQRRGYNLRATRSCTSGTK